MHKNMAKHLFAVGDDSSSANDDTMDINSNSNNSSNKMKGNDNIRGKEIINDTLNNESKDSLKSAMNWELNLLNSAATSDKNTKTEDNKSIQTNNKLYKHRSIISTYTEYVVWIISSSLFTVIVAMILFYFIDNYWPDIGKSFVSYFK